MKKITLLAAALLLTGGLVFTTMSCSKDDDDAKSCTDLANEASAAGQAFTTSPTAANCNAYKAAINAYVDGCDALTQEQIDAFDATLALLNCDAI